MSGPARAEAQDRRVAAELAEVGARHGLGPRQCAQLETLLRRLAEDPRAPTTITDPPAAARRHVADSLAAVELPAAASARAIVDLGSGAGFPGLALAIARPQASVALVESAGRKCAFLRDAAAACGAHNATVVERRAEGWPEGTGAHHLAVARALAPLPVVLEYAAPLLVLGGSVVVWRGARRPDEELTAARAAQALGLEPGVVASVTPFPGAHSRHLHVYLKVASTPPGFPRRPGMARKRPLGANSHSLP